VKKSHVTLIVCFQVILIVGLVKSAFFIGADQRLIKPKKAQLLEKKANSCIQHLSCSHHFARVTGCPHEVSGEGSGLQEPSSAS
jgi:hypothetical protein